MTRYLTRRSLLRGAGTTIIGGLFAPTLVAAGESPAKSKGHVVGEPTAQKVGAQVLADGGNAVDAIVAAALSVAIAAPYQTGIGGYGGCATLALEGGKKITAVDFNSTAPAAARADMFKSASEKKANNTHGWLAAGVPGILAGLQLLLDRYGTRKFSDLVKPAIHLARDGFLVDRTFAAALGNSERQFTGDPGSRKLYFMDGKLIRAGERFRNPGLADLLTTLAQRGSVESFYRGDIAQRVADAFQKNGGLVTAKDMATYTAREVKPLALAWGDCTMHTAPPTAGGLTFLQAFRILEALRWQQLPAGSARTQARIEALRLAWRDRLTLLGDPDAVKVPIERLLSADYARECAAKIETAVKAGTFLSHAVTPRAQSGTIHLSAADSNGTFIALTLTHGGSFGARVTVEDLGLTLGHGMSRFDTQPDHPNAPGPGKRPLHNMCPTIVVRAGHPVLALGGRGGRKIPNAMFEALTQFVVLNQSLTDSLAAPRSHTEGNASLELEKHWSAEEAEMLRKLGYKVTTASSAVLSAVVREKGDLHPGMR